MVEAAADEGELLEKARSGERSAFEALQKSLEPQVRRFIRHLIGKMDVADEIVQDAFLALYLNIERIRPATSLRPFLFRVVRNLCYDELRRKGRYSCVSLDGLESGWGSEQVWGSPGRSGFVFGALRPDMAVTAGPDDQATWSVLLDQVRQAMDKLPESQRQALILYAFEQLSYSEVAEAMATDIGTVKSRIYYARLSLVKSLAPDTRAALGLTIKED